MQEFTKKQIKGIINIINSEPCKTRPALQTMRICRDGYAYITNGYVALRWRFETEVVPKDDKQKEFVIPVENLIRWYKLANAKDELNELTILELEDKENSTEYPDLAKLFKDKMKNPSRETLSIDLNLIEMVNQVTNCRNYFGYSVTFYGSLAYGIEIKRKSIEFLIMGLNI